MKPPTYPIVDRTRKLAAISLAALLSATSAYAQSDAETIRRLQAENASLRQRLAELERNTTTTVTQAPPAAPATAAPRSTSPTAAGVTTDEGVLALSPFEV